jgi:hypothetical protein
MAPIHPSAWKRNSPKFGARGSLGRWLFVGECSVVNRAAYIAVLSGVSPRYHG